ncbi:MAG TPA: hypothetical protein DCP31_41495 [Cyanobacteria bacterium UBA8543]|nr:hypothetical protein [Cyanobacteria bacterium UBA8543]
MGLLLLGLWLIWDLLSHLVAEILWFSEVGYLPAFVTRLQAQLGLWVVVCVASAGFCLSNLFLANRLKYPKDTSELLQKSPSAIRRQGVGVMNSQLRVVDQARFQPIRVGTGAPSQYDVSEPSAVLTLRSLLPVILLLSLLVGLMLLHYGKIALSLWHRDLNLPNITPSLPLSFGWKSLVQLLQLHSWGKLSWQLGVLPVIAIALIVNPQFGLTAIAVFLSLLWSFILSGQWSRILQYFHATAFNAVEPLFKQDISFYVFSLPVWQLLEFWLGGLFLFCLVAVTLIYLLSGDSFSQGKFPGFSQSQLRHLYGLASCVAVAIAGHYWMHRYQLMYSTYGLVYGAGYTDITTQLPIDITLLLSAGGIALFLLIQAIFGFRYLKTNSKMVLLVLGLFLAVVAIADGIAPVAVQRLVVQPNELVRERPYIQRSIDLTRQAFALNNIEVQTFDPKGQLTYADIQANDLTIRNIRLWDKRPLLETNRELQQIRLYYKFPDADIDRYTLKQDVGTDKQQVIIAARELDYNAVPQQAQTWINQHLIYTHGYGFTLSPVNTVGPGGLPDYFVKDIATTVGGNSALKTSDERIRASIPIGKPRIYYGEITNNYVMTSTKAKEFDYPSGDDNAYNIYDGKGGVAIGSWWRRLLFAQYLKDWQMPLTQNFTSKTKLLLRRNINQRIRAIAPFLRYDSDPYLVTANASGGELSVNQNYLYWIVDAYTTSDRYPYSDPGKHEFNYIRNSVKVVIDAYHGDVNFYVADPKDPIIHTWSVIFPKLFKPLDAMPAALRSHIRYPQDLFGVQSDRLLAYHMTDPQVFYNREDQWQIPQEIYGTKPQTVEPYYLIMKLPTAQSEEFILLLPFTPTQRTNLIAWLAARSDGEEYGKLLLYQFPKQVLIYGTEQIEALINQDPVISQQISLWSRQGSRALQGNLLVIPIERSLLYVEPLYLEAEQNSLPTLVRVIVVYENRIVMAKTLEQALQAIFQPNQPQTPAIIRPVEEPTLP